MVVQCCKCKKVRRNGAWEPAAQTLEGPVTHTYCPPCEQRVYLEIFSFQASQARHAGATLVLQLLEQSPTSA